MKAVLDGTYGWLGQTFGPGEVEIPDDLAQALGLKTAEPAVLVAKTESLSDLDSDDKHLEGKADGVPDTATSPRSSKGKKPSVK
jgi:hypothetical protein